MLVTRALHAELRRCLCDLCGKNAVAVCGCSWPAKPPKSCCIQCSRAQGPAGI